MRHIPPERYHKTVVGAKTSVFLFAQFAWFAAIDFFNKAAASVLIYLAGGCGGVYPEATRPGKRPMRKGKIRLWPLAPVLVGVCAAGWWAGAFCGTEAALAYSHRGPHDFNFFRDGKALVGQAMHYFPDCTVWDVPGLHRIGRRCG
ncbi:unnamed protein product, partial [marine sediment metagenome]